MGKGLSAGPLPSLGTAASEYEIIEDEDEDDDEDEMPLTREQIQARAQASLKA